MQDLRYLNLFGKISQVRTQFCFKYNEVIVFCVPKPMVAKAVGMGGRNIRKISEILRKRVKVVAHPQDIGNAEEFIRAVVSPVEFNSVEVTDDQIIINAGSQSKAALIGRNRRRFLEMQKLVRDFFKRDLRIV
jgi:transcription antitermination factor NusA-like protein